MNLVDSYVTRIVATPWESFGKWWVKVEADCYGQIFTTDLMFGSRNEALKVNVGYHFLS